MSRRPVDPGQSLPQLEEQILQRWRERDVFKESIRRREGAQPWVFYEGPPTANGRPGSHHVLARAFKDVFPRFQTMRGKFVERKAGWDCHGLPVEIAVEKALGIQSKAEIEAYGIEAFNQKCRESVFEYVDEFQRLTERIGYWVDLDDAYRTLDPGYIEQVWGSLRQIWDKELLYEGHRVVPYCPRCGTALSSHELAQGYQDDIDPSVFVRFPVTSAASSSLQIGDNILAWTTTPWTLPSNAALAVHPELDYVRARVNSYGSGIEHHQASAANGNEVVVLAATLVEKTLGEDAEYEVIETLKGAQLVGASYKPPFGFITSEEWGELGNTVLSADFVTAEDGTGVVHTAIAFGADDYELGTGAGLKVINPVRNDGTYDERITGYTGRFVIDANADLVKDLRESGALWLERAYEHSYPHCWRCSTHLIYYARPSWYIGTSKLREQLLEANSHVNWHPEHVRDGRFGEWLKNNIDWALSRERYWGTPLPIWRCDSESCSHDHCIGSFEELNELSGIALDDPHRPYVDDVKWACTQPGCAGTMVRVPEVIDVWFDSGAVPFAQHHKSIQEAKSEGLWPAQYICEALDQTRGWFYSLLAISVLLGDQDAPKSAYETVLCLGLIADESGQKMSKSKGNIVVPWEVLDQHGADAFRWYFFTSKQPWDGYRFSTDAVGEGGRLFLRTLWNTYAFLVLYENASDPSAASGEPLEPESPGALMDRWILSRLASTTKDVTERLEDFDVTFAGRLIASFVDDLSNWYVRRSRRRFWEGDPAALATLRECLITVAKLLAPLCPFIADEIYDNLDGELESVHLCDWPEVDTNARDEELERAMETAREAVRLGLAARGQSKLKVRQPLKQAIVVAAGHEKAAIERLGAIVRDELNVHELNFAEDADELGSYDIKANFRTLGPRFGKGMPKVAAAVAGLDPAHVSAAIRDGGTVSINVDGSEHELVADDLILRMQPLEGYQLEREGGHAVALDLHIDDELRQEALAREVVHAVQAARKNAGLDISDRIRLSLDGDVDVLAASKEHMEYLTRETLALEVEYSPSRPDAEAVVVDGQNLRIGIIKV